MFLLYYSAALAANEVNKLIIIINITITSSLLSIYIFSTTFLQYVCLILPMVSCAHTYSPSYVTQCHTSGSHGASGHLQDTQVQFFPPHGMDWEEYFQRLFRTPHHIVGLGITDLEGGETYEVWDLVTLPDRQTPYAGYSNDERQMVVIPE